MIHSVIGICQENAPNILYGINWQSGYYYNDSGVLTSSSSTIYSEKYIPIQKNSAYTISITDTSSNRIRVHEYGVAKNWLRQSVTSTSKSISWTTSANAVYIRVSLPNAATNITITINNYTPQFEEYHPYVFIAPNSGINSSGWFPAAAYVFTSPSDGGWLQVGGAQTFMVPFLVSNGDQFTTSDGKIFLVRSHE